MNKEDKELLLKDLCARLPYKLCVEDEYGDIICLNYTDLHFENYFNAILEGYVKPYLFPLSSMTEEEQRTLDSMCNGVEMVSRLSGLKMFGKAFNWLNENHFDYRGLIEKGLAIDATGKKIY